MATAIRWLLVPFTAAFGCWSGILLALLLHTAVTSSCPKDQLVSGMCMAAWFPTAEAFAQIAGAASGAAIAVLLPFAAAPSHKRHAATAAFVFGAAFAAYIVAYAPSAWPSAACAMAAGLAALAWLWRRGACQR